MYQDRQKSKKVFIESNCVSRDDCCWDETPEMLEVVAVNKKIQTQTEQWPEHWSKQL